MGVVDSTEKFCQLRDGLEALQPLVWGFPGGHPGIHNEKVPDEARVAWDLNQVIRQMLAFSNKPGSVDFNRPFKSSETEPLCVVEPADGLPDPRPTAG